MIFLKIGWLLWGPEVLAKVAPTLAKFALAALVQLHPAPQQVPYDGYCTIHADAEICISK